MLKILLPIDGSHAAQAAVHCAIQWVRAGLRATVVLANVQEPASLYEVVVAHDAKVIAEVSQAAAVHCLEPAQALLRAAGVAFESEVATGDAGHQLIEIAERLDCDLVMLGARGVGDPGRSGLGSVAKAVLEAAKVPVTVIRTLEG